ncbi:MAG: urea carboxylase-associated family protein [Oleiphilaceae bacterium]|nr:urea carboxylase-associated family protein [Oleiphilaceae bacterium]
MKSALYEFTLPGGHHWSFRMRRNTALRLTDLEGGANLGMLIYNPENPLERYNAPDSLKAQHTFRLGQGNCLYSDMGRCFASLIRDDFGGHDTVCGYQSKKACLAQYGHHSFQDHLNDWTLSGEESFLKELAKYGLGERDVSANLNLFSHVVTDSDGNLQYDPTPVRAGASTTLRFDMDALVIVHSCPHPLNPATEYPKKPVHMEFLRTGPVTLDDECLNHRPENRRALENNRLYYLDEPVFFSRTGDQ